LYFDISDYRRSRYVFNAVLLFSLDELFGITRRAPEGVTNKTERLRQLAYYAPPCS